MNEILKLTYAGCRRWVTNTRFYLILLLTFCFIFINQGGIAEYLSARGMEIQALELYGFTLSDTFLYMELIFLYTFMMCDIPFFHAGMDMELIRTDRTKWLISRLITTSLMTIAWLLFIEVCIILVNGSSIYWANEWSMYLKTAARISAGDSMGINIVLSIDPMTRFSPAGLFLISFLYYSLFYSFLGISILLINLWTQKNVGCIMAVFYVGFRFINRVIYSSAVTRMTSPADLVNIAGNALIPANIIYTILYFVILGGWMIAGSMFLMKKIDFTK